MSILPSDYKSELEPNVLKFSTSGKPPQEVIDILESGVSWHTRRCEIYESDNETLWRPLDEKRLVAGSVNVDSSSDERRKLDLTLDNSDGILNANPTDGFWYDKIIKVYRGVKYATSDVPAYAAMVANSVHPTDKNFIDAGLEVVDLTSASQLGDILDYSYVISLQNSTTPWSPLPKLDLLKAAWNAGKHVISMGVGNDVGIPFYSSWTDSSTTSLQWGVQPPRIDRDTPVRGKFQHQVIGGSYGYYPKLVNSNARILAEYQFGTEYGITATLATSPVGSFWLDFRAPAFVGSQLQIILKEVINFIQSYYPYKEWEMKLGEFMIDQLTKSRFPKQQKITGRDFTKKMLLSKIANNTTFTTGDYTVRTVVEAVATNAGIDPSRLKIDIDPGLVFSSDMAFDRGTDRWTICKQICDSFNYELFFDSQGFLVARLYEDPTTTPVSYVFNTGSNGNLVDYEESVSDSRVFNHYIVWGDPADGAETLPYFGEAKNEDPDSPTCIQRIGDRVDTLATNWLTSDQDCYDLALTRLKIGGLESYDLSFDSIYYPWLEAGEIVQIDLPDANPWEPNRFLLDTIDLSLDLGPMSATGGRVTFVGDSGGPPQSDIDQDEAEVA